MIKNFKSYPTSLLKNVKGTFLAKKDPKDLPKLPLIIQHSLLEIGLVLVNSLHACFSDRRLRIVRSGCWVVDRVRPSHWHCSYSRTFAIVVYAVLHNKWHRYLSLREGHQLFNTCKCKCWSMFHYSRMDGTININIRMRCNNDLKKLAYKKTCEE